MSAARASPHALLASLCVGVAAANLARASWVVVALGIGLLAILAGAVEDARLWVVAGVLFLGGWWWGSTRLAAIDRSVLLARVDTSERSVLVVTGPVRRTRFQLRVPAHVRRFGWLRLGEPVLLELPLGRSPPQGGVLEAITTVRLPKPPKNGFDERTWLARHGVHVVLRADRWKLIGQRGGLAGVSDRLRAWLAASIAPGLHGERRGVVEGVVLGDEQALPEGLRNRFRASGLYHLLAVSGQNVALVAAGAIVLAWLLGFPRWLGQVSALCSIAAYVLAVGPQPSVVRAAIAGALGSVAWLLARQADRWYFLLLGALVLLAWNPYVVLDAGFQLSFAAVTSIFLLVPRFVRALEGYPLPAKLAAGLAVSTACGLVTAPVLWFQFHAVPLLSVPANALAAPAVPPLLALGFAAALAGLFYPPAGAALAWLNGWCAAYLAACARIVGGLPGAQVRSGRALLIVLAVGAACSAYAWRRWHQSSPRPI